MNQWGNKSVQETGNYGILAAEQSAGEGADKEEEKRRLPDENKGIQLYCTKTDGKRNQSGIYRDRGSAMHLNDALGHQPGLHCLYQHHEQACAIAARAYGFQNPQ